jgi:hypothetical protein
LLVKGIMPPRQDEQVHIVRNMTGINVSEVEVAARIDSTAFLHRSWVRYWARVKLSDGRTVRSDVVAVRVYNVGLAACIFEFEGSGNPQFRSRQIAEAMMSRSNHALRSVSSDYDRAELMEALQDATVFHTAAHGNNGPPRFTCRSGDAEERVFGTREGCPPSIPIVIREARIQAIGRGSAPFNSGKPPVHISLILACNPSGVESNDPTDHTKGVENHMAEGLLVTDEYGNVNQVGRALTGWRIPVYLVGFFDAARAFWKALRDGETADRARRLMVERYGTVVGENFRKREQFVTAVHGDPHAHLHGVYTGSHAKSMYRWFLPLP